MKNNGICYMSRKIVFVNLKLSYEVLLVNLVAFDVPLFYEKKKIKINKLVDTYFMLDKLVRTSKRVLKSCMI